MSQGKELTYEQKVAIVHVKQFMDREKKSGQLCLHAQSRPADSTGTQF